MMMDGTSLVLAAVGALALAGRVGSAARRSADLLPSALFHGTRHAFDRFVLDHEGRKDFGWLGRGIYLTDDETIASMYARQKKGPDSPRVLTVSVAPGKIYVASLRDKEKLSAAGESASRAFSDGLIKRGYIGAVLDHGNFGREFVIFDPSRIEVRGVRGVVAGSMSAPGYRSWSWTQQDWRSVEVGADGALRWDRACGAKGTRKEGKGPPLCLPRAVIEELAKTAAGCRILTEQAERKAKAAPGARVPWHPEIKKLHAELQAVTPKDKATRRKR